MQSRSISKNTGAILNTTPRRWELLLTALLRAAPRAAVQRNQLALLHVELFGLHDFPFVKAARAQGFAFMFLGSGGFFKGQDVGHGG